MKPLLVNSRPVQTARLNAVYAIGLVCATFLQPYRVPASSRPTRIVSKFEGLENWRIGRERKEKKKEKKKKGVEKSGQR